MHIIDIPQGSYGWQKLRLGLISASRFKDILTEPRSKADKESGKLSGTAEAYMNTLIAEILTGEQEEVSGKALDWGKEHEDAARWEYEFVHSQSVDQVGICIQESLVYGASPDGLVGEDGMIEIKCPFISKNHIATVINGMPSEHMPQIQGNLLVNGRQWCDFISFDPRIDGEHRLYVQRIERDEKYIANLEKKLNNFSSKMQETLKTSFGIDWQGVNIQEYV
ncbi:YqaJ viral recombinase family protein [Oceanospirillum phage vB_OliS_GJ44]|nr:YqaJ viral recombinase family protein [Oceanospirillum phage vB_OliS_GJ44]